MEYLKKASGKNTKFRLDVGDLYVGWMDVQITVDGESFWYCFDEIYDNVIDLMNLYNTVAGDKNKRGFLKWKENQLSFYWNDSGEIRFTVDRLDGDRVRLCFDVHFFDPEELFKKTVTLTKTELFRTLDDFFGQILASKGFPFQYPFGCDGHDKKSFQKVDRLLDEIVELLPKALKDDDDFYRALTIVCTNALGKLEPEAQKEADEYRSMLKTHILPVGYH